MSHYPPPGPPYGYWPPPPPPHHPPPPPHHHPPPPHHYPPPPHPDHHHYPAPPGYPGPHPAYYIPGAVMLPVPVPNEPPNSTYITNYIYHGESSSSSPPTNQAPAIESSGDYDWVPSTATTANHLQGRALVGGHEGWDGSPLWVIRAWHNGDLIPGKLAVRHSAAYIMYDGKEIPVQNIEVLCSRPETLRWVPASNGNVPAGAVPGGRTAGGETLYVGRARHQLSITPGKVHPSHNTCYISFGGCEVSHKMYDVLCTVC